MIDKQYLVQKATKQQTIFRNILREYYQNLFLSLFYQNAKSEKFYFKGGTALRLVFGSPRYSEDLDFTSKNNFKTFDDILERVLISMEKEGIFTKIIESKKTSRGMLAVIRTNMYNEIIDIKIETSQREKAIQGEKKLIISDLFPSYTVQILKQNLMIGEKIDALLERHKARDFYDLYFILRANLLSLSDKERVKDGLELLKKIRFDFAKELKIFLPKSHWGIIKDFKKILSLEVRRVI
jgi:predicted nucleotidyltransferase component of viral defense system